MPPTLITADGRDRGQTLAAVMKARLGLPWSQVKKAIERRQVRVGSQVIVDPGFRIKLGKQITIAAGALEIKSALPAKKKPVKPVKPETVAKRKPVAVDPKPVVAPEPVFHPDILFVDESLVVVNKPAGLTTTRNEEEAEEFGKGKRFLPKTLETLLPGLLGTPNRPVIAVHRIDRDTSGIVVFARTKPVAQKLMSQFRKHTADRRYLALVRGEPRNGRIESQLTRDRGDGRRGSTTATDVEVKRAVTHVSVLESLDGYALVECRLETGRTHQVRIHLGEAGTPLCGERVYDRPLSGPPLRDSSGAQRPMLHAARLGFEHPETGEFRTWEQPAPTDFAELLTRLRSRPRT